MATILVIDSSARPHGSDTHPRGSHTRRLTGRFSRTWRSLRPFDRIVHRDVGSAPPTPVTGAWIQAAFTQPAQREPWMREVLCESDQLVDELLAADVIVAGVPMYNFNVPAQFKAYIDNIVRVGRTFGFDRARDGEPYWPMLGDDRKTLILLGSRGDYGYDQGQRLEVANHVERSVTTAFAYIGITDVRSIAIEYDEFGGERLQSSIARAEAAVDELVRAETLRCGAGAGLDAADANCDGVILSRATAGPAGTPPKQGSAKQGSECNFQQCIEKPVPSI